jgi:hypothetical protein
MAFFLLLVAVVNVALGYWLGLLVVRPDLFWRLRHRATFAAREWADHIRDLPSAAWGILLGVLRQPPSGPAS